MAMFVIPVLTMLSTTKGSATPSATSARPANRQQPPSPSFARRQGRPLPLLLPPDVSEPDILDEG